MSIAVITGSAGLVGSQAAEYFENRGMNVVGIDNDMRRVFFGKEASVVGNRDDLKKKLKHYIHKETDIRRLEDLEKIFQEFKKDIRLIIHAAAQPSHDWAATDPLTDFTVNANGTLNLLELTRRHCPEAVFIFVSTNKVYGDHPNHLPLKETADRWDLERSHPLYNGIKENLPVDECLHSLFGASKMAADLLVQEYGRYFGMKTACFRAGCLTGPRHMAAEQHGFLAYLMKCAVTGQVYTIFGYEGKQVRDNIHSLDLVRAFECFYRRPQAARVYNIGGGRLNSCSIREAIGLCEKISGQKVKSRYEPKNRIGDHKWYITDFSRFTADYPEWKVEIGLEETLRQIHGHFKEVNLI